MSNALLAATVERMAPDPLLRSSRFPAHHGFTTRAGGVSEGPFASLNLGFKVGDDPDKVVRNHERLVELGRFAPSALRLVSQVHGDRVLQAREQDRTDPWAPLGEADAVWTEDPGLVVGIRVADCVPILLADPVGKRVAAVHSGWRGTELRISQRAVETLGWRGSKAADLRAAIGPHIRSCCYAVSAELAGKFQAAFGKQVAFARGGQWSLDLTYAIRATLEQAGVSPAHIDDVGGCTSCDPERFFSHRRDRGVTGRHLGFVACRF